MGFAFDKAFQKIAVPCIAVAPTFSSTIIIVKLLRPTMRSSG